MSAKPESKTGDVVTVRLVRGLRGTQGRHRQTLQGLGLRKMGDERILEDTACVRGMINQVGYMIEVER